MNDIIRRDIDKKNTVNILNYEEIELDIAYQISKEYRHRHMGCEHSSFKWYFRVSLHFRIMLWTNATRIVEVYVYTDQAILPLIM